MSLTRPGPGQEPRGRVLPWVAPRTRPATVPGAAWAEATAPPAALTVRGEPQRLSEQRLRGYRSRDQLQAAEPLLLNLRWLQLLPRLNLRLLPLLLLRLLPPLRQAWFQPPPEPRRRLREPEPGLDRQLLFRRISDCLSPLKVFRLEGTTQVMRRSQLTAVDYFRENESIVTGSAGGPSVAFPPAFIPAAAMFVTTSSPEVTLPTTV
jgi:hypothetical protein